MHIICQNTIALHASPVDRTSIVYFLLYQFNVIPPPALIGMLFISRYLPMSGAPTPQLGGVMLDFLNFILNNDAFVFICQVCAMLAVATVAGWSSKGVSYGYLNRSDFNVLSNINFFIAIAVISIIFLSINVLTVLLNKRVIPPKIVSGCLPFDVIGFCFQNLKRL